MVNYKGRNWNILATFQLPEGTSNMKTKKKTNILATFQVPEGTSNMKTRKVLKKYTTKKELPIVEKTR